MLKEKITVVIPAYNEELTIGKTIKEVKKYCDNIIVSVAKKSKDRTAEIGKELGAKVIFDHGLGKGDGIISSIEYLDNGKF